VFELFSRDFDGFTHYCSLRVLLKCLRLYGVEKNYTLPEVSLFEILHSTQNPMTFDFDTFPTPTQHSLLKSNV
jgi:hypothetical protein